MRSSLTVESYKVHSITPLSFHSFSIIASFKINNDTCQVEANNINMIVYKKRAPILNGSVLKVLIPEGKSTVKVQATVFLNDGTSIISLVWSLFHSILSDYSADIQFTHITKDGITKDLIVKGIKWEKLIIALKE